MKRFVNIKIGNIEARICKDGDTINKYEIVYWKQKLDGTYCYVISFIDVPKDNEDAEIRTVSVRLYELEPHDLKDYRAVLDLLLKYLYGR